uniref:Uncharacterized protein n=1 Tax=Rhizophora mucronata TaxID=61149 RepID=A0A2P2KE97_RHIMU
MLLQPTSLFFLPSHTQIKIIIVNSFSKEAMQKLHPRKTSKRKNPTDHCL